MADVKAVAKVVKPAEEKKQVQPVAKVVKPADEKKGAVVVAAKVIKPADEKKDAVVVAKAVAVKPIKKQSKAALQIKALKSILAEANNPEITKLLTAQIAKIKEDNVKLTPAFYQAVGKAFIKASAKTKTASREEVKNILAESYKAKFNKI